MFSFPFDVLIVSADQRVFEEVRRELATSSAQPAWKPARQSISRRDKCDIVLLETSGLDDIGRIKALLPGAPVIVLQVSVDYQWGLAAIREGASDYLSLDEIVGGNLYRTLRFWVERWKVERALQQSDSQLVAVQRMEALGRTVAGVAHDFRHFLQVVYGNCSLMKRLNENPALDEMIDEIKMAGEKANRLIKQMLDFAQGSSAVKSNMDINESLKSLEPLYKKLLGTGSKTECHLAAEPLNVSLDSRFEQVVMNLVANAGDAIGEGRGRIIIETRALTLERDYLDKALLLEQGAYVILSVSDTGGGIDARDLDRIFDPFFTTKGRDIGTGLGLSVVFSFLQEWKGHITVASIFGQGTTFNLIFPRESAPDPPDIPTLSRKVQLLLNEPNDAIQLVIRRDLTALGHDARLVEPPGPTLKLEHCGEGQGLMLCQLSPRLMDALGLMPEHILTLATPFSRSELARKIATLAEMSPPGSGS